jgi:hypothetical protein
MTSLELIVDDLKIKKNSILQQLRDADRQDVKNILLKQLSVTHKELSKQKRLLRSSIVNQIVFKDTVIRLYHATKHRRWKPIGADKDISVSNKNDKPVLLTLHNKVEKLEFYTLGTGNNKSLTGDNNIKVVMEEVDGDQIKLLYIEH